MNAELPNPSSCFIVPLSMGQSLSSRPSKSAHWPRISIEGRKIATSKEDSKEISGKEHHNGLWDGTFCSF